MRQTQTSFDGNNSRNRQRATETTTTTRTIEDLAESQSFRYVRIETDYGGAWRAGLNLAGVAVLGVVVIGLYAVLTGASLAWLPVAIIVAIPVAMGLPVAVVGILAVRAQTLQQRTQYEDARAALLASQRRAMESWGRYEVATVETTAKLETVQQRTESRQLALSAGLNDDLTQFCAAVFVRNEPVGFRHWKGRNLPSGQVMTFERWQSLTAPLVAVGSIVPPAVNGGAYNVIDGDYSIVTDKLRRAGYVQS